MDKPGKTREEYLAEYDRLCGWRSRWLKLANDRTRMRKMGGLQTQMEYVCTRAQRVNRKIAQLMRDFDADVAAQAAAANAAAQAKAVVPPAPSWHAAGEMRCLPKAWYWAQYPGSWEWYCPERNQTRGLDHGDSSWHPLMAKQYWGPWVTPPVPAPVTGN